MRTLLALLLLVATSFAVHDRLALHRQVIESGRTARRMAVFEAENERLRGLLGKQEKARTASRAVELRTEIERAVEEIRGLKFSQPVTYSVVTRQGIKDVVAGKLAEMYSEQDFAHISASLARLGLLPPDFPLRQKYIELLGEQIAAFYDQHTHQLFMFEDASLENTQNRVVLAHELTHALQDQNFGLLKLPLEVKDNDDRAIAASALVEGEATQVMSAYMMRNFSLRALKESAGSALTQDPQQLARAPRFLREMLLFPYLRGQAFTTVLSDQGGYEALSRCYERLPASTAEILHPERYLAQWQPAAVAWADPAFDGQPPTLTNVVGEAGLRVQLAAALTEQESMALAAQWKGDRYLYFAHEDALVWKSTWATEEAAERFAAAQRRAAAARYPGVAWPEKAEASTGRRALRLTPLPGAGRLLVDAPDAALAQRLEQRFTQP